MAIASRLNDLVVMPRRGGGAGTGTGTGTGPGLVERVLFDAERPVLLIPPGSTGDFGRKVVIAWNGTPQVARAVSRALPLSRISPGRRR